jgi:hypothetical protein
MRELSAQCHPLDYVPDKRQGYPGTHAYSLDGGGDPWPSRALSLEAFRDREHYRAMGVPLEPIILPREIVTVDPASVDAHAILQNLFAREIV